MTRIALNPLEKCAFLAHVNVVTTVITTTTINNLSHWNSRERQVSERVMIATHPECCHCFFCRDLGQSFYSNNDTMTSSTITASWERAILYSDVTQNHQKAVRWQYKQFSCPRGELFFQILRGDAAKPPRGCVAMHEMVRKKTHCFEKRHHRFVSRLRKLVREASAWILNFLQLWRYEAKDVDYLLAFISTDKRRLWVYWKVSFCEVRLSYARQVSENATWQLVRFRKQLYVRPP